jgi:xanthine dehydrogenase small subunit
MDYTLTLKVNHFALIRFILNDKEISTDLPPGMVMLDLIRYQQHLPGTKIGCREGDCGACTILVGQLINGELNYLSMTSCLMPLANANGKHIVTIEGINFPSSLNPVQEAMAAAGATQCGFCTPGFVMSLAGYCLQKEKSEVLASIDGNICRCTGYKSIERAARKVEELFADAGDEEPAVFAARKKILPEYFSGIRERLAKLEPVAPANNNGKKTIIAGGTDLYVQRPEDLVHESGNKYVFGQQNGSEIKKEGGRCIIWGGATVTDLRNSQLFNSIFPGFMRYSRLISSTAIRNMATLAGNFVNASPIGDMTVYFLGLETSITLTDGKSSRELHLKDFYKGYKQLEKREEEWIDHLSFEIPGKDSYFNFEKVSKRTNLDIASVNSAMLLRMEKGSIIKASLSAGGVGPIPTHLGKTSAFLEGKPVNDATIEGAIRIMKTEISPISDTRGSKEYKSLLLQQLIKAHFVEHFPSMVSEDFISTVVA